MGKSHPGRWRGSAPYWEKLAKIYALKLKTNRRSYIYISLADALVNLGRVDEAIETLEYGLALLPESRAAKVMLAQLHYDLGAVEKAKIILEEVVNKWPDVPAAVSLLCKIYQKQGAHHSAWLVSESLLDYYPDSTFVQKLASDCKAANGPSEMAFSISKMDIPPLKVDTDPDNAGTRRDSDYAKRGADNYANTNLMAGADSGHSDTSGLRMRRKKSEDKKPRQETLFALETMLCQISRLKEEN